MSEKQPDNEVSGDDGSGNEAIHERSATSNNADEPVTEAKVEEKDHTEEYPHGFVFAMILVSVLSSLFLVALVSTVKRTVPLPRTTDWFLRTEPSSLPPSRS